jgi:tetratricopeptide (TPR) repeat protein
MLENLIYVNRIYITNINWQELVMDYMLYLYIGIGVIILAFVWIITARYSNREKRYKKKLDQFLKTNQFAAAIDFLTTLISISPHKAEYYLLMSETYEKAKMIPHAIENYHRMIKKGLYTSQIKEQQLRERITRINFHHGRIIEAFREAYSTAVRNPKSDFAFGLLGHIYGSQGKYDVAKKYLKKAIQLKASEAEYHYLLGALYLDTSDLNMGVQEMDTANDLNSNHLKNQYFLALACRQSGLNEKANKLFRKLNIEDISKLPDNVVQIGIMTQNIPKFEIGAMEDKLIQEVGVVSFEVKKTGSLKTIEDILKSGPDEFHESVKAILTKMGYQLIEEVKTKLTDSSSEINYIGVNRRDKDNPSAKKFFIQFSKINTELGTIPFSDFLSKMVETGMKNGILVTTSGFASNIADEAKKEKGVIHLIDHMKLKRFL